jgi:hypothetical protein
MGAHGSANKYSEELEKSGIRRRRRFSRGDGTTDSSQCGVIIEADAGSIRLNTKLHPQTSQVHGRRLPGTTKLALCWDFEAALSVRANVFSPFNETLGKPKGFSLCGRRATRFFPRELPRALRLPQQDVQVGRIARWNPLTCEPRFSRGPDRCAKEDEILDEELARIPQQRKSM